MNLSGKIQEQAKSGLGNTRAILNKAFIVILFGFLILLSGHRKNIEKEEFKDAFIFETQVYIKNIFKLDVNSKEKNDFHFNLLSNVYYEHNYKPIWTFETQVNKTARQLINILEHSEYYGISSDTYNLKRIEDYRKKLESIKNKKELVKYRTLFETALTHECFKFMINLRYGVVDFDTLKLNGTQEHVLIEKFLIGHKGDFEATILSVQPTFIEYHKLQKALEKFVKNVNINNDKAELPNFKTDLISAKISAAEVLIKLGYLEGFNDFSDSCFSVALAKYQNNNHIKPTGELNRQTIKKLERSTNELYQQIAFNLNMYKQREFPSNMIFVNLPAYKVSVIKDNNSIAEYRAVIGKKGDQTPQIDSKIDRVVVNPYWTVPKRIAFNEIIPRLKRDDTYLSRNGFKIIDRHKNEINVDSVDWDNINYRDFDYVFRQDASHGNALGKIKFLFDNDHYVYLHDTPSKKYFNKYHRAYSHGCVRVDNPMDFATDLFKLTKMQESVSESLSSRKREEIFIEDPIDISLVYFTCSGDDDGNVIFYDDIYKVYSSYNLN